MIEFLLGMSNKKSAEQFVSISGIYAAKTAQFAEVKASPLVTSGYASEENKNKDENNF